MLRRCGFDHAVVEAVRHHHEWWNGKGYPDRLKESEIPLFARIIAVADAYDAMTSARPYKTVVSSSRAIKELLKCAGSQFDPDIVQSFASTCREDNVCDVRDNLSSNYE